MYTLGNGQTAADCKEGFTQPHHTSLHQTGGFIFSGDATETIEGKHKRVGQDNSASSSQRVSPTTLTLELALPHVTAPTGKVVQN